MKRIKFLMISMIILTYLNLAKAQIHTGVFRTPTGNTDYHHFTRGHASGAAVYINQVSTGPILRLSSGIFTPNQGVKFTFENNGYLGIGTNTVTEKLVLYKPDATQVVTQYGNSNTGIGSGNGFIVGIESAGNGIIWNRENNSIRFGTNALERMRINKNGSIDIFGSIKSKVYKTFETNTDYHHFTRGHASGAAVYINQVSTGSILRLSSGIATPNQNVKFTIENNGSVGIGTINIGNYMLAVNGNIRTKEINVETDWSDFVFNDGYYLRDLKEVETYITKNKHLPDIPTAKEVKENGINLGEMDAKLLRKIEELTLYTIEQQKQIDKQMEMIEFLGEKIEQLEKR